MTAYVDFYTSGVLFYNITGSIPSNRYYISSTGLNTNAGTTSGAAWGTFAYAQTQMLVGDTLQIVDDAVYSDIYYKTGTILRKTANGLEIVTGPGLGGSGVGQLLFFEVFFNPIP